jgi:deoxyribodipyrimidine photo-lyase
MTALMWFRRDLRVRDNPALRAALDAHEHVVPVFCLDDRLLHGRHASGSRTQFMLECLTGLDAALRERGAALVVRRGAPEQELPELARACAATDVYFAADVSPYARERGRRTGAALIEHGLELHACPGLTVVDDVGDIATQAGTPYSVFSPFHRNWEGIARRDVLAAPRKVALPGGVDPGGVPALDELGLSQEVEEPMRGGEDEARRRLAAFMRGPVEDYGDSHDALGDDGTSRLSPYLHFGCVSALEVEARIPGGARRAGPAAFKRQLAWRDFYHHVLLHFPGNAAEEFQPRYRRSIDWNHDHDHFRAWCEGRTGFPLVDAGMRQLRREGWMHNRARLVVGSFLTKDLGIDWRLGERWFMRLLIDGDEANNNGNWQWIASVGVDPQPHFRRIYNPARQMERFDPRGAYVRRHVPELAGVPDDYLREPWTMPAAVQEECGVVIGRDYPEPIVDHGEARREAMERYRAAAASSDASPRERPAAGSRDGARADTSRL